MNVHDTLFWFFSIAMLLCGVGVIASRNPVNCAMFLVVLFFFMAGLFVLLEAFFLAAIQVLVGGAELIHRESSCRRQGAGGCVPTRNASVGRNQ